MLSIKSINAGADAAAAARYFEELGREDYYTEGGEPPGKWIGSYAQKLGLAGQQVQHGQLERAFTGHHPENGEALATNAGPEHKPGYDLTFSAPKSVSVIWATADRQTQQAISAAQQRAVERALAHAEQIGAFHQRAGHAGAEHIPHGEIAAATFEHSSSRNGDAQLHTHAVVVNLAENGKRVEFDSRFKMELGAAYRAELARELRSMGFQIERDGKSFSIAGVPADLTRELSSRRAEIEQELAERGLQSAKAAAVATLDTRHGKGEVDRKEIFENAREAAARHKFDPDHLKAQERAPARGWDSQEFLSETFAQASTLSETQLRAAAYVHSQDRECDPAAELDRLRSTGDLVQLADHQTGETRYTSREMLDLERGMADTAGRMAQEQTHGTDARALDQAISSRTLSDDQKQALQHISQPDRIAVVQGVAGAGKSYMLDAARETWERSGYQVVGAALAGKAAEGLEKSSNIKSDTLHKTLAQLDAGDMTLGKKHVIVIDEAGMVGSRQMSQLLAHADRAGAKVVLVGDVRQLQPIDAGGAMRAIQQRAGHAELNNIRRQQDPAQRDMVAAWAKGDGKQALERLENLGAFQTHKSADQARQAIAQAIVQDMQAGKTSIALAGTRREVQQVNQLAREQARAAGLVKGNDSKFETERGDRQFAKGDRLIFLKNDRQLGIKNGTTGTVLSASENSLRVQLDDKSRDGKPQIVEFSKDRYAHVDHGYSFTVHKSQGITVDRAHYQPGAMADLHSAYVACSRHRDTVKVHGTVESLDEFRRTATRERSKDTSADYKTEQKPERKTLFQRVQERISAFHKPKQEPAQQRDDKQNQPPQPAREQQRQEPKRQEPTRELTRQRTRGITM